MFEAYITNTALYPLMGIEVGTTVHFPMTTQELQAALAKIGIDGKRYSEVFFTSFDSDVLGLYDHLYECENIDELNELGHALLEVRDKGGLETFEAALVLGNHTRSVKDLINLTQNLDLYRFYPDISDDEGLGRLYADELGTIDIPEHIQNYFDYEAYGRDVRINEGGVFAPGGYVSAVPEGFKEYYHGPQDIPPEHRIFAYGRMIEIYLLTSLAPIPFATVPNRETGHMGQNYFRSLFAVGFQGLLILVCVAIYAVLIQSIATDGDPIGAIWGCVGYTVLLCFTLFKTGSLAKSIFGCH